MTINSNYKINPENMTRRRLEWELTPDDQRDPKNFCWFFFKADEYMNEPVKTEVDNDKNR